ncbi:MAG: acyclic terpene utilization AtuA family protein [Pseudomonadota bacterium]
MAGKAIRIGGASGYWGESAMATPQLLASGPLDYLVYDYLAEITMSILARQKAKDPSAGYATDFITTVLKPNLAMIANTGVKLISNAGGLNPNACAEAARALIAAAGLDLKVAVVTGDDIVDRAAAIADAGATEMFTGAAFPDPDKIASINVYLGAFPIARALQMGADIVITGRCVDSAVTLGACIHEFGWGDDEYDLLASGSLAGHIIECGPQATGGNFTDWRLAGDIANIGYPIATVNSDGSFSITKPEGSSGVVSIGTISEQMVYEIGDPQSYELPDVICDFSDVEIVQRNKNCVGVSPARGRAPTQTYKTCATFADGFRTGATVSFYGFEAAARGRAFADAAFARARQMLRFLNAGDFTETDVEVIGAEDQFGAFAQETDNAPPREAVVKIAAKHPSPLEGGILLREIAGLGLASAPGLSGFQAGRSKPTPVMRLFSFLTEKDAISIAIDCDGALEDFTPQATQNAGDTETASAPLRPPAPSPPDTTQAMISIPLVNLAWARSGDKGDKANIGVIARRAEYLPYIWRSLSEKVVAARFAHFIANGGEEKVRRFLLPGAHAINFLIDDVLGGGGVASLRNDPQGKGYGQLLLHQPIEIPAAIYQEPERTL